MSEDIELVSAAEAFTEDFQFAFWSLVWRKGHDFYFYQLNSPDFDRNDTSLFQSASLIPRDCYMPSPSANLTISNVEGDNPKVYVKRPALYGHDPERPSSEVAEQVLHEAEVCQKLMDHPHPNVCRYFGYLPSDDGRVSGLCFERHNKSLYDTVQNHDTLKQDLVEGIRSGVEHLHSLGFVHNDINPSNIMLDSAGKPVIVDFDSCWPIGESLKGKKAGTLDWDHGADVSKVENDFFGLEKIVHWMEWSK